MPHRLRAKTEDQAMCAAVCLGPANAEAVIELLQTGLGVVLHAVRRRQQQQGNFIAAGGLLGPGHQFLADAGALSFPIDGQVRQIAAIGEIGDRTGDAIARIRP